MTFISVVVPVYKVQAYLRQCLDSVLDQQFTDIEVVAVDDRSPDGSAAILAEYAARDPRVRVVTLEENVGLGRARNVGLDHAVGEYVWFVDSDDWLAPGSLGAVARRLRATDAEVLVVGWDRVYWDGRVVPGTGRQALANAPDLFTAEQFPKVIDVLHVAWNKIVRRDLLMRLEFRFDEGWYEDISFTYPVFAAAQRISAMPRECVHYRQRRSGAITRTVGERHFEMFPHWDRAFELVDRYAERPEALRPLLFKRMIWHYLSVLRHATRVPKTSRRAFFARMTEAYRRHLPPGGYPVPGGVDGLRHRLVARGSYRSFEVLRAGAAVLKSTGRHARRAKRVLRRGAKRLRQGVYTGYYRVQLRLPVDRSLALYAAYWYRGVACNPAAIAAKAGELAPQVRRVWVVNRARVGSLPPGTDHVITGSLRYYRHLARARWLFNNVNWPNHVVKRRGTVHVMTHHGTPLKKMGMDQADHPASIKDKDFAAQMRRADRWDFSISANAHTTEAWERAYPCRYETLEVGYPRNDRLATATAEDAAVVRERLGIRPHERVVLYTPTHREWLPPGKQVLDVEDFADELGPDTVLLVRAHYFYVGARKGSEFAREGQVIDVSAYPVVEELYLAADVLMTDYSSAMFDYAVLDRPVVIFAPDWSAYQELRGVYFDLMSEPPGVVATTYPDLLDVFRTGAYADDTAAKARAHFRARFAYLDDGGAAERVVRRVLLEEPVP
jgi:CDP-glycerol glycerophosphotransferase